VDLPLPHAGRDISASAGSRVTDTVVLDTGRGFVLWVFDAGLACCAVECAAGLSRVTAEAATGQAATGQAGAGWAGAGETGAGEAAGAPDQGHGNVFIVAGTVTDKLAPLVLRAYQRVPGPKWVLSFGACSNSGGPYWDSYCVTKGVDQLMPVDVYVPGCPPRPEALLHGLDVLAQQSPAGRRAGRP
jgi:NADH-quinone oxidoreductase subunit B